MTDIPGREEHPDFITIYESVGGWKAVWMTWNQDYGGFYEPWQTGIGYYDEPGSAIREAQTWAADEGINYVPPKEEKCPSGK